MDISVITGLLLQYKYAVLLPLAIVEGPLLAFVTGTLVALGYFYPLAAFGILVLGDVIPDTFFYVLGRYGSDTSLVRAARERFGITDELLAEHSVTWRQNPAKAMLITKFAYGISAVFLFLGGLLRIPPRIFFGYSITISIVHYGLVMIAGYLLGNTIESASDLVVRIEIGVAVAAFCAGAYYIGTRYIRRTIS